MDRAGRAFTLIELLVVTAIIALLVSILAPTLHQIAVITRRTTCGSNLRQYGHAMTLYTNENHRLFPSCHSSGPVIVETTWIGALHPFAPNKKLAMCPEMEHRGTMTDYGVQWEGSFSGSHLGYGYNMWFLGGSHQPNRQGEGSKAGIKMYRDTRVVEVVAPSMCLMFADSNPRIINGRDTGCGISLFWPLINRYKEGVNGSRHHNAGVLAFVDGHAETFEDPDNTINPPYDYAPDFIEHWDHLQRRHLWP